MNNNRYDFLYCQVHDYVTSELEGKATASQRRNFAELIRRDEIVRQIYVAYMQEQTSLRWSYANQPLDLLEQAMQESLQTNIPTPDRRSEPRPVAYKRSLTWLTLAGISAALLAFAFFGLLPINRGEPRFDGIAIGKGQPPQDGEPDNGLGEQTNNGQSVSAMGEAVATVRRLIDVTWASESMSPAELSRLRTGQTLELVSGQVELLFDTGVEVLLEGKTHFEVRSAGSAYSRRGAISARVGEEARGFTIVTPSARVIDLGTEFGVTISESGETEVAVFRGIVDLTHDASEKRSAPAVTKRLNQGEALRVGNNGEFHRVFAVASDRFPMSEPDRRLINQRQPLLSDVRDNIRDPESKKFYKIVRSGLQEDSPAFVDRNHQWNGVDSQGLPAGLLGAEYIMPFNDDKRFSTSLEITLFVARPVALYLFFSDAVDTPDWLLKGGFVDTGDDIGLDEAPSRWHPASRRKLAVGPGNSIDTIFSIWRKDVPGPSQVVVGGVERPADVVGFNMYGIAAVPLD